MLPVRGISYLVGEVSTDDVRRDLEVIARNLHCTTVMLIGDGKRLIDAARTALGTGLGVYIRPSVPELPQPKLLEHLDAVAAAAEELRLEHPGRVTLLVGSEFSHTAPGIVPGPRSFLRLKLIVRLRCLHRSRPAGSGFLLDRRLVRHAPRIRGDHPRDEAVQARYVGELIGRYDAEGVHGCFVFTFAMPDFPHHDDPRLDLDKAGFGVVAVSADGVGRPKEAFHEVARRYSS
ncbi:hypothetical protein [Nonomuraea typhae]|uniref:Uncharacterized protein n=1 Tax=Nonomuraea typhae TaxID=2603600 RepID=A0ABW7Z6U2_9ACTN